MINRLPVVAYNRQCAFSLCQIIFGVTHKHAHTHTPTDDDRKEKENLSLFLKKRERSQGKKV